MPRIWESGRALAIPEHVRGACALMESEDDVLREVGWATVAAGGRAVSSGGVAVALKCRYVFRCGGR